MRRQWWIIVLLVFVAAACGADDSTGAGDAQVVEVKLTDDGCVPDRLTARAGEITFRVTAEGSGAVTEFEILRDGAILGEVENVAPGLEREFRVTLDPGTYETECPGGSDEEGTLEVTE